MKFNHFQKKVFLKENGYDTEILFDFVKANPTGFWGWDWLSANPNITWEMIRDNSNLPWKWSWVSRNPNITIDILKENPEFKWNWCTLCDNPNITLKNILDNKEKIDNPEWSLKYLSRNSNITFDTVKENPNVFGRDIKWDCEYLSQNPNITIDIVKENLDMKWHMWYISQNPNFPFDIVKENFDTFGQITEWKWQMLSSNPTITWDIIKQNPTLPWDWNILSSNFNFTIEDIKNMMDSNIPKYLNWNRLSCLPNITMEIVKNNPSLHWERDFFSRNPNVDRETMNSFLKNPRDFFYLLSNNKLFYDDTVFNREYKKVIERKDTVRKVLYKDTGICPDIIKEIVSWVS